MSSTSRAIERKPAGCHFVKRMAVSAGLVASLSVVSLAAGCVADGPTAAAAPKASVTSVQRLYDCGDGQAIAIRGSNDALELSEAGREEEVRLHASPPGQNSRYDAGGHALVLNGDQALWMKAGEAPMSCRR
jgi:hypothetical protein